MFFFSMFRLMFSIDRWIFSIFLSMLRYVGRFLGVTNEILHCPSMLLLAFVNRITLSLSTSIPLQVDLQHFTENLALIIRYTQS